MTELTDETVERLILSNQHLIDRLRLLAPRITVAEDTAHASKIATRFAIFFSVLALISAGLTVWSLRVNCENNNEARAGNLAIWLAVLSANASTRTPSQTAQARIFDTYVREVYSPHDCNNPFKKVTVPNAPRL